jgi:putative ABC transport system permease protein
MLCGLAVGVAVVFSVDIANQSAKRAFALSLDAVTGRATHQITGGAAGVDETVYTRLRRDLGVRRSAPIVEGAITLRGLAGRETLQLLGVDLFAEPMFRTQFQSLAPMNNAGRSARESLALLEFGTVIIGNSTAARLGLEINQAASVNVTDSQYDVRLINVVDTRRQPAFDSMVMTDIATAQWLLGMEGRLSRIDLIAEREADLGLIRSTFADIAITDAARRNNALQQMTQAFHTNLVAMSLLALLVGAFLIYNTVTLSVLQRRLLFGQLRVAGVDRVGLSVAVLIEVILFALAGIALGLILGYALGGLLLHLVTRTINDLYFTLQVRQLDVPLFIVIKVTGMALFTALVAAAVPSLEAARSPPITLTQRSSLEHKTGRWLPRLAVAGLVGGVVGLIVLLISTSLLMAFVALFLIVVGYSLMIPICLRWLVALSDRLPFTGTGATGQYPMRSLSASLSRMAVAVTALAVAVSATAGVGIMIGSFRASVADWLDQTLQADVYIRDGESLDNPLPQEFVDTLKGIPGSDGMRLMRVFDADIADVPARVMALQFEGDMERGLSLLPADVAVADQWQAWSKGDSLFISEPLAWQLAAKAGQTLPVLTDSGVVDFTVAGVFTDYGAGRGLIVMPMATMQRHWADRAVSSVGLAFDSDFKDGVARLRPVVKRWPQLLIRSDREIRDLSMQIFDQTFAITHVLRVLTTAVAFIGVLCALLSLTLERRREFAVLRALGTTPAELYRVLLSQTAWMGLVAGILALPLGVLMSAILVHVINRRSFGWSMQFSVSPAVLWECVAMAVIAALLAALYPARQLARMSPSVALRQG